MRFFTVQLSGVNMDVFMVSGVSKQQLKSTRDAFRGRNFISSSKTSTKPWVFFLKCSTSVFCLCFGSFGSCLRTQWKLHRSARVRKAFTHKDLRASGWKNCVKWCKQRSRSGCWILADCVTFSPFEQWNLRRCGLRVSLRATPRVFV